MLGNKMTTKYRSSVRLDDDNLITKILSRITAQLYGD